MGIQQDSLPNARIVSFYLNWFLPASLFYTKDDSNM